MFKANITRYRDVTDITLKRNYILQVAYIHASLRRKCHLHSDRSKHVIQTCLGTEMAYKYSIFLPSMFNPNITWYRDVTKIYLKGIYVWQVAHIHT